MSKPIRFISPFLLVAFSLLLFTCGKEETSPTVINGKVTDKKSGLPIEGADIYIEFYQKEENGNKIIDPKTFVTDQNGEFHYSTNAHCNGIALTTATKKGYNTRAHLDIVCGQVNNLDIKLIPKDGILRLNVINSTGLRDSIWVVLENPSRTSEAHGLTSRILLNEFPVDLSQSNLYTENFDLTSEEFTTIYWGFVNILPAYTSAPFRDSVYLILNDTTDFTISF